MIGNILEYISTILRNYYCRKTNRCEIKNDRFERPAAVAWHRPDEIDFKRGSTIRKKNKKLVG